MYSPVEVGMFFPIIYKVFYTPLKINMGYIIPWRFGKDHFSFLNG